MNYTKAQQEIVAWIMADTERGVRFANHAADRLTTFFHPDGSHAYTVPDYFLVVSMKKCRPLDKLPPLCPVDERYLATPTGNMVEQNKHTLVEFNTAHGQNAYFDKRLLDKFGKKVKLYQSKPLTAATIVDAELNVVVGYLCPVRRKIENQ